MIIKVCGMRDADNIIAIDKLGVDWMGFIFYPKSPRYVDALPSAMPSSAKRVGVFVNEDVSTIELLSKQYSLDFVQLHGDESPEICEQLTSNGIGVIKAFSVNNEFPSKLVNRYQDTCQYYLFDTKTTAFGGSGHKFDWDILSDYMGRVPFLLSGGISEHDIDDIIQINHPKMVGIDINSRFEISPALKDEERIKQFIKQYKQR